MSIDYTRTYFGWPASSGADYANPTLGLVIHYNGPATNLTTFAQCVNYWKNTRNGHLNSNGWADIGYSFGISVDGKIFEGRGLNRYQAAQGTTAGNGDWYSVTLMIGGNEQPTPAQVEAVKRLRSWLMSRGMAGAVRGHRDFVSTSCPGTPLYGMVQDGTFTGSPSGGTPGTRPLLRRGSTGVAVRELQQLLTKAGHSLAPYGADGDFGATTESAVRAYQSANGLDVDGIVGPATWASLLPTDWFSMSDLRSFQATTDQTLALRDWRALHLGDGDYSLAFQNEDYLATVNAVFVFDAPEGVDVRGEEIQLRFVEVRPNPDADKAGEPAWIRSKSLPITSPVHDAGKLHTTAVWQGKLGKDRRLRVEANHFIDGAQVTVERVNAQVRYTK